MKIIFFLLVILQINAHSILLNKGALKALLIITANNYLENSKSSTSLEIAEEESIDNAVEQCKKSSSWHDLYYPKQNKLFTDPCKLLKKVTLYKTKKSLLELSMENQQKWIKIFYIN